MKLHYYPETNSLYIELELEPEPEPGTETREITDGLNIALDAKGDLVGLDIDHASTKLDLATLETEGLPTRKTRAA